MKFSSKFILVSVHCLLFAVLTFLGFLGLLTVYVHFVPEPIASALEDLNYFAPIMAVGALILGIIQALVNLWLYSKNLFVFWGINIMFALMFGGFSSFFSIWIIWTFITGVNLFLVWVFSLLLRIHLVKSK